MKTTLLILEFLVSAALIIAILIHSPKGEGLGSIGGIARMFNSQKGMESGLTKATGFLTVAFFVIAGILGVYF
jgi:preprotein translocase subunit SecG